MNINDWIRPQIQKLSAYHVPEVNDVVKLDAMENPYQWPSDLQEKWLSELHHARINRYPDPEAIELKQVLKDVLQISEEHQVMFGNGSDEIIQIITMAVAEPGRVIMAPEPSFVMYRMIAEALGLEYIGVPLLDDFSLDKAAMLKAIEEHNPAVIFLLHSSQ